MVIKRGDCIWCGKEIKTVSSSDYINAYGWTGPIHKSCKKTLLRKPKKGDRH
jgi:hypothetical protein